MKMTKQEVVEFVHSACADMGMDRVSKPVAMYNTKDVLEAERLADKMFDDSELLADMIGDHIYGCENRDDLLLELHDEGGSIGRAAEIIIERM